MRKSRIVLVSVAAVLLAVVAGALVYIRSGPTAPGPTEDPVVRLNREHADLPDNAVALYDAASASLREGPKNDWIRAPEWASEHRVPQEVLEWLAENAEAIRQTQQAAQLPNYWFMWTRGASGMVDLHKRSELLDLAKLFMWRARAAAERRNLDDLADSVNVMNRIGRHVCKVPHVVLHLTGIAHLAVSQETVLAPYTWADVSPDDRAAYAQRIFACFEPPPPLTDALVVEQELSAWRLITNPDFGKLSILAPQERYCGELERYSEPLRQLSEAPVEVWADSDHPLRKQLAAMEEEKVSALNVPRMLARVLVESLPRVLDLTTRLITIQRGNRTVIELFAIRDRTGRFPASLDEITQEFKIDPYTGQAFVYRITDNGFTVYSAGLDRDNDGGNHHEKFGEQRLTPGGISPPPDGDYVFWPIPES